MAHGPRFLYLMSTVSHKTSRIRNRIGDASNPFKRILEQNRVSGHKGGSKATRSGAPNWKLELVIGPFVKGLTRFRMQWEHQTRELNARILKGIRRARAQRVRFWARDPERISKMLHGQRATRLHQKT